METFVVRVFRPVGTDERPALTGFIEQVGTNWTARFTSDVELLDMFHAWLERASDTPPHCTVGDGPSGRRPARRERRARSAE